MNRLHPTLADYVAIAINPVLVMGLVGSLIYFLLEVLYQGAYPDRLQFCLTMFVIGTVLISRIAMEDGFEHAAPFGAALAVVVALALARFVDYGQSPLAEFGWAINLTLMTLTWWCAHQLTWDSTLIDEDDPDSQGLLETVGIDSASGAPPPEPAPIEPRPARGRVLAGWERVVGRKGRPHAAGVWVVYFSLASLPIFGIGQLCIPASNQSSRRYVFGLLAVYVACALGLLLTTSFLGLRRYLRQKRLEMPPILAGSWLAIGGLMIVGLLLFVALLPRPNPEYAISELPLHFGSPERSSNSQSVGEEGTHDEDAPSGSGVDHSPDGQNRPEPGKGGGKESSPDAANSSDGQQQQSSDSSGKGEPAAGSSKSDSQNSDRPQNSTSQPNQPQKSQEPPRQEKSAPQTPPGGSQSQPRTTPQSGSAKSPPPGSSARSRRSSPNQGNRRPLPIRHPARSVASGGSGRLAGLAPQVGFLSGAHRRGGRRRLALARQTAGDVARMADQLAKLLGRALGPQATGSRRRA